MKTFDEILETIHLYPELQELHRLKIAEWDAGIEWAKLFMAALRRAQK